MSQANDDNTLGIDRVARVAANAAGMKLRTIPSYDEGSDFIPEDQVALIHRGEAVVPAEENPENPDNALIARNAGQEKPAGLTRIAAPHPSVEPSTSGSTETAIQPRDVSTKGTPEERAAIAVDKRNAMGQGVNGLVALGTANLHERHLGAVDNFEDKLEVPKEFERPRIPGFRSILTPEQLGTSAQDAATATPEPIVRTAAPAAPNYKDTIAGYNKKIQAALDEATPEGQERADRLNELKEEYIHRNPWGSSNNHPGILGKLGHIAEEIGARLPVIGEVLRGIPGTEASRNAEHNATLSRIQEETPLTTARGAQEAKESPKPKLLTGEENVRTDAQGNRDRAWQMPDDSVQWVAEGQTPTPTRGFPRINLAPGVQRPSAVPAAKTTIGTQPNVAAAAASVTKNPTYTYGKAVPLKEGELPATASELADVETRIAHNPYVPEGAVEGLRFPEGYQPTKDDVKERLVNIKEIEDATRQGQQDKFNNGLRKLQEENANLIAKARLQELEEKQKAAEAKNAQAADVAMVGLYSQEHYKDVMQDWYKSGNFAKDSGLITEIVDKEHGEKGAFSGVVGDALVGSLLGPEGAALGAGAGALTGLLSGPANGYLDTLKKQGISDEGYNAMQAYFNALPARMSYEIGVQGVSASALRSSQLIQKVLNTIPSPNTPQSAFDGAFRQYYKPMETLTKGKIKLTAPKGYEPPSKEAIYPEKDAKADAPPAGATHTGVSSLDGKEYYLDAQGKKLGLVPAKK